MRLTLNLGVRYELVKSDATGGIIGVDTDTTVPRLAATFDLSGNGRTVLQASFAHYAGKYNEAQIGRNSTGRQSRGGDSTTTPAPPARAATSRRRFDLANYEIVFGSFPTANIFLDDGPVIAGHARVQRVGAAADRRSAAWRS